MKKISITLIMLLMLCACSTSGNIEKGSSLGSGDKTIYVSKHYSGYEERHIDQVVRTLEKHNFTISSNKADCEYYLDFMVSAGAVVTVNIEIRKNGKKVISAKSSNAGWGTLIARPVAIASRVDSALSELDELLDEAI